MITSNPNEQKASDTEKINFLRSCTDHKLFNFLLDDLEASQSEDGSRQLDYDVAVRWTRKHPWEIQMNTDLFARKWGRTSFHSLSRILNQLSSVRIGAYCILKRQSIGVYRFLGGYNGESLPIVPKEELCENPRKRKATPDALDMNVTPKRVPFANQQPPMTMVTSVTSQFFTPAAMPPQPMSTNPFTSFSPGDFFQMSSTRPQASSVFMSPPTPGPANMATWTPHMLPNLPCDNQFPNIDHQV